MEDKRKRCCNIDWLQVYLEESHEFFPCNAEFFQRNGWDVRVRDYGTSVYREVFELRDNQGHPLFEITRNPRVNSDKLHGAMSESNCHLRLANRTCYYDNPLQLLRDFLITYDYEFISITRLDVCLDFLKFDSGIKVEDFVKRYMAHTYTKIQQSHLNAHAMDEWHGRTWESLSWGSPASIIKTKIYNKTKELEHEGDKPYIRQAWLQCGLISDFRDNTLRLPNGKVIKPTIWRIEFSIKAGGTRTYILEDNAKSKRQAKVMPHRLQDWDSREKCFYNWACLASCYFRFKKYKSNVRKDRCEDVDLFNFSDLGQLKYRIGVPLAERSGGISLARLKESLIRFMDSQGDLQVRIQINALIKLVEEIQMKQLAPNQYDKAYIYALQMVLHHAAKGYPVNFLEDIKRYQTDYQNGEIF